MRLKLSLIVALCVAWVVGSNYRDFEVWRLHDIVLNPIWIARVAEVFRRHREDDLWTFLGFSVDFPWWTVFGILVDCLEWISAWAWLDFRSHLCVWAGRASMALERWKSSTGSYSLYIHWVFYLVFFQLTALRDVAKAAIQLQEIQVQLWIVLQLCLVTLTVKAQVLVSIGVFAGDVSLQWECEVLIAAASPNGHIRCRDNCQICQPETGPLLVVTSTGSKYHCSGCRTTEKSKQMTLSACPICYGYGMRNVKAEWLNSFEFESHKFERGCEKSSYV